MRRKPNKAFDDDDKTIFSTGLNPEEREAVRSGEERGKRMAVLENPERFGMAGQHGRNLRAYEKNWERIWGSRNVRNRDARKTVRAKAV